jgi:hypothetical protein
MTNYEAEFVGYFASASEDKRREIINALPPTDAVGRARFALARSGAKLECLSCGADNWWAPQNPGHLNVLALLNTQTFQVSASKETEVFVMVCGKCFFVRSHVKSFIDGYCTSYEAEFKKAYVEAAKKTAASADISPQDGEI